MNSRERWLAVLQGQKPDRLPTDYWATPEFNTKLKTALGARTNEELSEKLGIDNPCSIGARLKAPGTSGTDIWGIRYETIMHGTGGYAEAATHPLANFTTVAEVHAYPWPSADQFDFSTIPAAIARNAGQRIVRAGGYEPFLLYCNLRGMEQAYEDLLIDPEFAEAALTHIFEFFWEQNRRTWEAGKGKIDIWYLAEDLGGQTGPLFSMEVYRRFLRPNQKKLADLARTFGIRTFYHTDGAARPFLPDLINEVGIEILNPIQWRCPGMERNGLARDFSSRLAFHGGIDNQHTLPFGTPDDVRREVRECAEIFHNCRWICAPCHNIQNVSPVENVIALYETAREIKP